jgi:uncharacterized protein YdhG (YjbR/CyaY superfamily)
MLSSKPATMDEYLSHVNEDKRQALLELRKEIREMVPDAEEGFSYGVPAFRYEGRPLAGFAAAKNHCSLYPMSSAVISQLEEDLKEFETSKGAIRFVPDRPIPKDLLRKIIMARKAQIDQSK